MFKYSVVVALAFLASVKEFVGGEVADIKDVPYQVYIAASREIYDCTGTIISKFWIVTGVECAGDNSSAYTIHAGSSNRKEGGSRHTVSSIIMHEKFDEEWTTGELFNDIALMRVNEPFEFDSTRQPIGLFNAGEQAKAGTEVVVSSWKNRGNEPPGDLLQITKMSIASKEYCQHVYKNYATRLTDQICAEYVGSEKSLCQHDQGAPLVINGRLAGLASWGDLCPSVYTEIAAHREWIKSKTGV